MSAHKTSDDMRSNAQAEAARIIREAEGRSVLMQRTQAQTEDTQREIDGMRLKRRESEVMLESMHRRAAEHARVRPRAGRPRRTIPAAPQTDGVTVSARAKCKPIYIYTFSSCADHAMCAPSVSTYTA